MSQNNSKQPVLAVVGPTACGKTSLSIELALALGAEILCCDSRAAYKYFDICSAKALPAERKGVPHHLTDLVEPEEHFSAGRFAQLGRKCIEEIAARGNLPLLCGGTGLYARALLEGISMPEISPDFTLRQELREIAEKEGNEALWLKLKALDPLSAQRLHVNDRFRIVRALEVSILTKRPFSQLAARSESPYQTTWIGLTFNDRQNLKDKIRQRLLHQMDSGLLAETKRLYERCGPLPIFQKTVAYRDLIAHIEGRLSLEEAVEASVQHGYQLARRQMMWFKANPLIHWFAVDEISQAEIFDLALSLARELKSGSG